jgi:hypothetical protein
VNQRIKPVITRILFEKNIAICNGDIFAMIQINFKFYDSHDLLKVKEVCEILILMLLQWLLIIDINGNYSNENYNGANWRTAEIAIKTLDSSWLSNMDVCTMLLYGNLHFWQ